ncbi:MAG: hypothetical protein Crog4KO_30520 [Crocinitomicaceae bacterium]
MKSIQGVFLLLLAVFLFSCSEARKRRAASVAPELNTSLFRTEYFIGDVDENFSFPNWFNDSLLVKHKIQSITHHWYSLPSDEDMMSPLQKTRIYTFDETGQLLAVQQKRFYENLEVENITFKYTESPDEMGFAELEMIDSLHSDEWEDYNTYHKEEYQNAYAVYENDHSGDFLFCLLKKRFQGIVSVDSLFSPTPQDLVQYGSPKKPFKRYQIENLVKEKNVKRFGYFEKTAELRYLISDNYPFSNKTQVTVNENGVFTGFIDSTFSADEYLNRTVSTFSFDENKFPKRLTHKGMRSGSYETFEYSYFE